MVKNDIVSNFISMKKSLKSYFKCNDDYFYKIITNYDWQVKESDGIYILKYWKELSKINECVLVKKDNSPLIYEGKEYTLLIGIECIKIGLIVKNK